MAQLTTTVFAEYASYLRARRLMEPQLTTQWLRLNHTFVTICREQLERILDENPECVSAHIFDIDQSELVRVPRGRTWDAGNDQLLHWLRQSTTNPTQDTQETAKAIAHGEGISRYTVVGPSSHDTYLLEVPIFNLPLSVSLIWTAKQTEIEAKKVAREAVTRVCESYLSTLLNIPLVQEILQHRQARNLSLTAASV